MLKALAPFLTGNQKLIDALLDSAMDSNLNVPERDFAANVLIGMADGLARNPSVLDFLIRTVANPRSANDKRYYAAGILDSLQKKVRIFTDERLNYRGILPAAGRLAPREMKNCPKSLMALH